MAHKLDILYEEYPINLWFKPTLTQLEAEILFEAHNEGDGTYGWLSPRIANKIRSYIFKNAIAEDSFIDLASFIDWVKGLITGWDAAAKERKCYLYRYFNKDGVLLYVGISLSLIRRQYQHSRESKWYDEFTHMTKENYATAIEATIAERIAIEQEKPLYNILHNTEYKQLRDQVNSEIHEHQSKYFTETKDENNT
jgi:predicted GIY-YIG superfamily endonuclease